MDRVEEAVPKSDEEIDSEKMDRFGEAVPKSDEDSDSDEYTYAEMDSDAYEDAEHKKYSGAGAVKASVWWNLEHGDLYNRCHPRQIKDLVNKFHEVNGHGPLSIFCYGDTTKIRSSVQRSLLFIGSRIKHCPVRTDYVYAKIIVDMLIWAKDNPPPATFLLILDESQISYVVDYLQPKGYKFFAAQDKNLLAGGPHGSNIFVAQVSKGEPLQFGDSSLLPSDSDKMDGVEEAVPKVDADGDAKVSVWWNLEDWDRYNHYHPLQIEDLKNEFHKVNHHGPLSIFSYGDTNKIRYSVQRSLLSIGTRIIHYPEVMKDHVYANIIIDMLTWAKDNPPPATLLLILDEGQISYVADYLQPKGYKFLAAQLKNVGPPQSNRESHQHGDGSLFPSDLDSDKMDGVEAVPKENVDLDSDEGLDECSVAEMDEGSDGDTDLDSDSEYDKFEFQVTKYKSFV